MPALNQHASDAKRRLTVRTCPKCGRCNLMTIKEWGARAGLSPVTLWRLMKRGEGPKLTEISDRRTAIREEDYVAWLDSRNTRTTPRPHRSRTRK